MKQIERELLAAMLGAVDGLHEPQNLTATPRQWQADWQRRQDYLDNGHALPWKNPGDDGASRKAYTRARDTLAGAGLAVVADGGKRAGLTPAGLEAARELCGLPMLADALAGLDFMLAAPDAVRWMPGGFVSETTLAGLEPYPRRKIGEDRLPVEMAGAVVLGMLPAIEAGFVEWRTGGADGVFLYALTPEGHVEAERRKADGGADAGRWAAVAARRDCPPEVYAVAWRETFEGRTTAEPLWPSVVAHLDPVDAPRAGR